MPAIPNLQPRWSDGDSGGISATAIGLIVAFGLVPCVIIIWVVIFLFFAYPNDRNWCCMKRKKHKDNIPDMQQNQTETDSSQETLHEKLAYGLPKRPFTAQVRTESGSSSNSGRLTKERRTSGPTRYDTRLSLQSVGSANTVQGAQEPKRFV